jgi:putative membrane protein insertion efficiency factor
MSAVAGAVRRVVAALSDAVAWLMIAAVRIYQWTLSPIIGRQCRFTPSCSNYFIGAVQKHGPWWGALRGVWRICRCNPFCRGGHDPP